MFVVVGGGGGDESDDNFEYYMTWISLSVLKLYFLFTCSSNIFCYLNEKLVTQKHKLNVEISVSDIHLIFLQ